MLGNQADSVRRTDRANDKDRMKLALGHRWHGDPPPSWDDKPGQRIERSLRKTAAAITRMGGGGLMPENTGAGLPLALAPVAVGSSAPSTRRL